MSDGDTPTKERPSEADESVTVTVSGVSASGTSDTGGEFTVEARGDAGGEASQTHRSRPQENYYRKWCNGFANSAA